MPANSSLNPIALQTWLYAIQCENDHVYVALTHDITKDIASHMQGNGAPFTRKHLPVQPCTVTHVEMDLNDRKNDIDARLLAEQIRATGKIVFCESDASDADIAATFRMRLSDVTVRATLYEAEVRPGPGCDYNGSYIGVSNNWSMRGQQHRDGSGSNFTHDRGLTGKWLSWMFDCGETQCAIKSVENECTEATMRGFNQRHGTDGWKSVRGGDYTALDIDRFRKRPRLH